MKLIKKIRNIKSSLGKRPREWAHQFNRLFNEQLLNFLNYTGQFFLHRILGLEPGKYRFFRVSGDSMIPTFYPQEVLITKYIDDWNQIERGKLYVLVLDKDTLVKRIYFSRNHPQKMLLLRSDNGEFASFLLPISKLRKLWEVKAKLTSILEPLGSIETNKIQHLELSLEQLRKEMGRLTQIKASRRAAGS